MGAARRAPLAPTFLGHHANGRERSVCIRTPILCALLPVKSLLLSPRLLIFSLPFRHLSQTSLQDTLLSGDGSTNSGNKNNCAACTAAAVTSGRGSGGLRTTTRTQSEGADLVLPVADFRVHSEAGRFPHTHGVWVAKERDARLGAGSGSRATDVRRLQRKRPEVSAGGKTGVGQRGQRGGPCPSAPLGVAGLPEQMGSA